MTGPQVGWKCTIRQEIPPTLCPLSGFLGCQPVWSKVQSDKSVNKSISRVNADAETQVRGWLVMWSRSGWPNTSPINTRWCCHCATDDRPLFTRELKEMLTFCLFLNQDRHKHATHPPVPRLHPRGPSVSGGWNTGWLSRWPTAHPPAEHLREWPTYFSCFKGPLNTQGCWQRPWNGSGVDVWLSERTE